MNVKTKKIFFSAAILLSSFCTLFSQNYNFHNYNVDQGLPFVQVFTIHQDTKGYLWSGGYGGLSRFNGKTFENYSPKNGLANHFVNSITEDNSGNIWVGTIKGLSIFDSKKFKTFDSRTGLNSDVVNYVFRQSNGSMWVCTDKGLMLYDDNQLVNMSKKLGAETECSFRTVFEDAQKRLWFGTDNGIYIYEKGEFVHENVYGSSANVLSSQMNGGIINCIAQDETGKIWMATEQGIYIYNGQSFEKATANTQLSGSVKTICFDKRKTLWAGTSTALFKYENGLFKKYIFRTETANNGVYCLYTDYESNLWIGSGNGLYKFRGETFITYNESNGLDNTFIYCITKYKDKELLIGTESGGIYKYYNNKFINYTTADGLPHNIINACVTLENENILFGTDGGLCEYDGISFKKKKILGLPDGGVFALMIDSKKNLWIGTGFGVFRYNGISCQRIPLGKIVQNAEVYALLEDHEKNIWIGTYLAGLLKFDGNKTTDESNLFGYKGEDFLAIVKDKTGNIYFGTFEGVFMYDGKSHVRFSQDDGLSSDLVYFLLLDDYDNTLWAGTNQGLNKIDIGEYRRSGRKVIIPYGKEEGFNGVECNSNGAFKDKDESIWFGTVNGLIHYKPNEFLLNNMESKTDITGFRLFYKDTLLPQNAALSYNENNISFQFIGICLTNPNKVRYSYMLEGYDKNWSPETHNNIAGYSNLEPGTYTFKVKSCNNENRWNLNPATFTFTIKTPWWQAWWFRITIFVLMFALVYTGFRWRITQIQKNENNKVMLAANELKALRAQMNPHFIFNALNSIQHFVVNRDENGAAKYLNKFAKLIRSILNNSEKTTVSIKEEIDSLKLYLDLELLRFENKFTYHINYDENADLEFYEIPTMLIQPYVENAILHGMVPAEYVCKLSIDISRKEDYLVCLITDDGIGRKKSAELKAHSSKKHKSLAMRITRDRLELLNSVHNSNLSVNISDLKPEAENTGTKVEIYIPID
jgi:ligand-binding sensor domain-containing protein